MGLKSGKSVPSEIGIRIFTSAIDSRVQGRMEIGLINFSSIKVGEL